MKIAPEKNTPVEDRIEFPNEWRVGSEHGLVHDGLQEDGFIELRIDSFKLVSLSQRPRNNLLEKSRSGLLKIY